MWAPPGAKSPLKVKNQTALCRIHFQASFETKKQEPIIPHSTMFGAPGRAWGSSLWWRPGNQETCSLMASSLAPSGCCPSNLCCSLAFRCPGGEGGKVQ